MLRRTVDFVVSLAALTLLSPLLLAAALAIVLDSAGSPFYRAPRIGQGGRLFRMWKLRTMRPDAERFGVVTYCDDPRITRLGRWLRRSKIDELPQFVNVLCGDMTLVGPRPEAPAIVAQYSDEQRQVLRVKPGVTGRAQLEVGEESDVIPAGPSPEGHYVAVLLDAKVRKDLEYLRRRTIGSDVQVVLATAVFVVRTLFRVH